MDKIKPISEVGRMVATVECLIIHEGKVLLLKRSENSKRWPGAWIGPGGNVDESEDYLSAIVRETEEETGLKIPASEFVLKAVGLGNHIDRQEVYVVLFFVVHLSEDAELVDSDEGKAQWVAIDEAKKLDNVFPPFKYYMEYGLSGEPGILYTNIQFENTEIKEIVKRERGK